MSFLSAVSRFFGLFLCVVLLSACLHEDSTPSSAIEPVAAVVASSGLVGDADWLRTPNFMEIYVRGYQDSDGDGIGDFQGLISRLDYLEYIGISALWLMPIQESSDNDHGYAVTDYRDVESDYGSMSDFEQLIDEAHRRGIAIVMDYVINHSSNEHPIFQDSRFRTSQYRDWYVWSGAAPSTDWNLWGSYPWHAGYSGYYYGAFWSGMPDFNLRNPEVVAWHKDNLRFWLNKGVDGFRFDAVGVLIENGAGQLENQSDNHSIMAELKAVIDDYPNRYTVCEAPSGWYDFANDDSCGNAFNFWGHSVLKNAVKAHGYYNSAANDLRRLILLDNLDRTPLILSNHDRFAGDRVWDQYAGHEGDLKFAAELYLLLSKYPFTYYGEEIGISNNNGLGGDHAIRTPMSWSANGGFSTVTPFRSYADNISQQNVADQSMASGGGGLVAVDGSLLAHYQALYQVRKANTDLFTGQIESVSYPLDSRELLHVIRKHEAHEVHTLINLSDENTQASISGFSSMTTYKSVYGEIGDLVSSNDGVVELTSIPASTVQVWIKRD